MKSERHHKILEIINEFEIETQEELSDKLAESGFMVTQATISRDIRELKLSKVTGSNGRQHYSSYSRQPAGRAEMQNKYSRVLREGYMTSEVATSLVVIKTVTGMAMAVAVAIDHMELPGVVGCIAGDDTIMCALKSHEDAEAVIEKINEILRQD